MLKTVAFASYDPNYMSLIGIYYSVRTTKRRY